MSPGILSSPNSTHPAPADSAPSSDQILTSTLSTSSHSFLQPTPDLQKASLLLAKRYLDPLAQSISQAQQTRLSQSRKKRKRGHGDGADTADILRLTEIYLEGFEISQVWEQARRVLGASQKELENCISSANDEASQERRKSVRFADKASGSDDSSSYDREDVEVYTSEEEDGANGLDLESGDEDMLDDYTGGDGEQDDIEDIGEGSDLEAEESGDEAHTERFVKDRFGLNDGFFSIDDFNRNTEFLEQQDFRGDDDDAASDEEDIDWSIDPMQNPDALQGQRSDVMQDDSEDDGPTFGNADLNAPWDSDEDDGEDPDIDMDEDGGNNANDIYYADFFAPPPRALTKTARRRPLPKTQPAPETTQPTDEDVERAMSSAHRDLFEEESVSEASDEEGNKNLSSHQKRQAQLAVKIRELEAKAVAKREWVLAGEARAADRPINSLLEQDLEFERSGKPIPVITAEVSSTIEDLIKQRIADLNFDEVPKRHPGTSALPDPAARRGLAPLDDRKADQSLAELYEADHLARTDPAYVAPASAALERAHAEVRALWADVARRLDALTNWHYRPPPREVSVAAVSDAPRIALEDARPSVAAGGVAGEEGGLAPQEVYRVGEERGKGDVVTKGGAVVGTAELSREQKMRRRRREKERARKGGAEARKGGKTESKAAKEKKDVLGELKKGGVKVIGKAGELRDVEGNKVGKSAGSSAGGKFKL